MLEWLGCSWTGTKEQRKGMGLNFDYQLHWSKKCPGHWWDTAFHVSLKVFQLRITSEDYLIWTWPTIAKGLTTQTELKEKKEKGSHRLAFPFLCFLESATDHTQPPPWLCTVGNPISWAVSWNKCLLPCFVGCFVSVTRKIISAGKERWIDVVCFCTNPASYSHNPGFLSYVYVSEALLKTKPLVSFP